MRDPDLRGASITVTAVDVSPRPAQCHRLRDAAGAARNEPRLLAAMRRAAPWVPAPGSARRAGLRYAPEIRFEIDRTFDEADRIGNLLRRPDVARDIKDE